MLDLEQGKTSQQTRLDEFSWWSCLVVVVGFDLLFAMSEAARRVSWRLSAVATIALVRFNVSLKGEFVSTAAACGLSLPLLTVVWVESLSEFTSTVARVSEFFIFCIAELLLAYLALGELKTKRIAESVALQQLGILEERAKRNERVVVVPIRDAHRFDDEEQEEMCGDGSAPVLPSTASRDDDDDDVFVGKVASMRKNALLEQRVAETTLVSPAQGFQGWEYTENLPTSARAGFARASLYYVGLAIIALAAKDATSAVERVIAWRSRVVVAFIVSAWSFSNIFFLLFAAYPWPHWKRETPFGGNQQDFLDKIGVVVPCHKSAAEIERTLCSLLAYFKPENIVVCDNGNSPRPADNTQAIVRKASRDIRYKYIPHGHKTQALVVGATTLASSRSVEYILHIDDDTVLSDNMVFDRTLFEGDLGVDAVAFSRRVEPTNLVTAYVDFYYKRSDHFGFVQSRLATRPYIPGPCGLWRLEAYMDMMESHPALPFGEDIFGSFHALLKGYRFDQELRCSVITFAPPVLHATSAKLCHAAADREEERVQGYGAASLWKQRAHRWTVSGCRTVPLTMRLFATYASPTWLGAFWFRAFRIRDWKNIVFNICSPMYLVFLLTSHGMRHTVLHLIELKTIFLVLSLARNAFVNYACWPAHIRVPWHVILSSPLLDMFLSYCAVFGRWKCILLYVPLVPMRTGLFADLLGTVPAAAASKVNLLNHERESQSLATTTDATYSAAPVIVVDV
ncbi:hypothetical protein CTAYLR_004897 [Chrysophaeum taylorii]|uniref:Glycosyltransferase 2-like domain-containing protein n=1 Tax=Chrysophaeum taylorii TaxID=2483200 RepID=A0AAD7UQ31_9STRA|nr:hypothetical protein CTAYLR_004897 [Chrysophaeum taylorii]